MAKAALEAIGGFNLFGKGHGSAWSKIMVKNTINTLLIQKPKYLYFNG